MGFSQASWLRVKDQYKTKYLDARLAAEARAREAEAKDPVIAELNGELRQIMPELLLASMDRKDPDAEEKVRQKQQSLMKQLKKELKKAGFPEDYLDVRYECPLCGDTGYVGIRMCDCMRKALIRESYLNSGMGELLRTQSFDNFYLDYYTDTRENYTAMEENLKEIRAYADSFESGRSGSMLFLGPTGLGKTHLCSAVAGKVLDKGDDVLYVTAVGMLADFEKKRFGTETLEGENASIARYYDCDLLIIDDLGTEVVNQFTLSVLYQVINNRLMTNRSMIINTNLSARDMQQRYTDRIVSRLLGECTVIQFVGQDVRMQKLSDK